jgi:hypothetical protein
MLCVDGKVILYTIRTTIKTKGLTQQNIAALCDSEKANPFIPKISFSKKPALHQFFC